MSEADRIVDGWLIGMALKASPTDEVPRDWGKLKALIESALTAARAEGVAAGRAEGLTEWTVVGPQLENCPEPHERYLVRRHGATHTATPCYGLHRPWWVVRMLVPEAWPAEAAPTEILPGDEWMPLSASPAGVAPTKEKTDGE